MKRWLKKWLSKTAIGLTLVALLGCAEILSFLPKVIATVTDAQMILDEIEDFVDTFFAVKPDPKLQRNVDQALDRCRVALNVALRTASGAEDLNEQQVEAAFDNFQKAYRNLLVLIEPLGVVQGEPGDKLSATATGLIVPPPLALDPLGKGR
jgi:hypothetical protein